MGISNRLRPALGRITSSVASTASYGITRVISFTDSFNERTSLLLDAALAYEDEQDELEASPPSSQSHNAAAPALTTAIVATFDIEAPPPATRSIHVLGGGQEAPAAAAQDAESKRVAKVVKTVCLFGASASLLLFVNPPRHDQGRGGGAMYRANLFFVCLGLFASLGLSMFSIVVARPGDPAVARVQKWGMVAAVASVLAASALRMAVTILPAAASLESAWVAAFVLAGVVAVYLSLAWKFGGRRQPGASLSSSGGSDHGAGGVADPV